ncbi:MAG TPA: helix-turn-helix transcriptional regulator [Solirubrobacteraceae bacterium]|nr:helix-turn-helix transcriptional regulator [Solirubrobacteraceae bacterium]
MSARVSTQRRTRAKQDSPDPALACALRRLRHDSGTSQEELAYRAGITTASFSRIERGEANPAWTTVIRIASALDISLAELVVAVEDAV